MAVHVARAARLSVAPRRAGRRHARGRCAPPAAEGAAAGAGGLLNRSSEDAPEGRRFVVGGNWKCNGDAASVPALVTGLNAQKDGLHPAVEVVVAPPMLYVSSVMDALDSRYAVAAQNCHFGGDGAFTGEVSPDMLADAGVPWVVLGHSERRATPESGYGVMAAESDELVAKKTARALDCGLSVIVCIGETLEQRQAGETINVCKRQLAPVVEALSAEDWSRVVLAYEPVWAIGTGEVATPEQAQEVHAAVRQYLCDAVSSAVGESTRIQYGGSVKPDSAMMLASQPDIDGFLIGGASLSAEDFAACCNVAGVKVPM